MDNKTSLLNFRFLEWATNDISYYGELFASLGLSPLAKFPNTDDVIW